MRSRRKWRCDGELWLQMARLVVHPGRDYNQRLSVGVVTFLWTQLATMAGAGSYCHYSLVESMLNANAIKVNSSIILCRKAIDKHKFLFSASPCTRMNAIRRSGGWVGRCISEWFPRFWCLRTQRHSCTIKADKRSHQVGLRGIRGWATVEPFRWIHERRHKYSARSYASSFHRTIRITHSDFHTRTSRPMPEPKHHI